MKPTGLIRQLNDCGGYVLVISLIMLVVLGLLGAVVMNLSGVDLQTAAYEKMSNRAFFSAESGVTQARSDMQTFVAAPAQAGQWPAVDTTVIAGVMQGGFGTLKTMSINGVNTNVREYTLTVPGQSSATFAYTISDIGSATDRTVLVTTTGTFQNVQQRIEAVIRYEPPEQVGSQECYTAKCSGVDQSSGTQVVNNENSTVDLGS